MEECLRHRAQSDVSDPHLEEAASSPGLGTKLFPDGSTQAEEMFLSQIVFKFEENAPYLPDGT